MLLVVVTVSKYRTELHILYTTPIGGKI